MADAMSVPFITRPRHRDSLGIDSTRYAAAPRCGSFPEGETMDLRFMTKV